MACICKALYQVQEPQRALNCIQSFTCLFTRSHNLEVLTVFLPATHLAQNNSTDRAPTIFIYFLLKYFRSLQKIKTNTVAVVYFAGSYWLLIHWLCLSFLNWNNLDYLQVRPETTVTLHVLSFPCFCHILLFVTTQCLAACNAPHFFQTMPKKVKVSKNHVSYSVGYYINICY